MRLRIELLSDLCTSAGEIYNTLADIDVVYDNLGFPYIPAKRIKGCIREAYLELVDNGIYDANMYIKIFGTEGETSSCFSINNAYLDRYDEMRDDIEIYRDNPIAHPQNVLGLFSYIRSQTSIDYTSGTAQDGSLRNMRVVKRGTEFFSQISFDKDLTGDEIQSFKNAAEMVTHMGERRTRGLGLVKIRVEDEIHLNNKKSEPQNICKLYEKNKIPYRVTLKAPMRCQSLERNQTKSLDYISGNKILGLIAEKLGGDDFKKLIAETDEQELVVTNAYICSKHNRCLPVSASLQKKKDQSFDSMGCMQVYDMMTNPDVNVQLTGIDADYIGYDGTLKKVSKSISYHHRRPSDKSIGRATGKNDGSVFYQLESINKGQEFCGYIFAGKQKSKKIIEALGAQKSYRIGNDKNSEFGLIDLHIENSIQIETPLEQYEKEFVVHIDSPVILYNQGMPSSDVDVLKEYLADELNVSPEMLAVTDCYLRYETIGGYNVTWHRRKPAFTAIGKGTVCKVISREPVNVALLDNCFIGERIHEGYGEIHVTNITRDKVILKKEKNIIEKAPLKTDIISKLEARYRKEIMADKARYAAMSRQTEFVKKEDDSIINRLLLTNKEQPTYEDMLLQIEQWSSQSKKDRAKKMMHDIEKIISEYTVSDSTEQSSVISDEEIYRIVSNSYLVQMKYQYRQFCKGE